LLCIDVGAHVGDVTELMLEFFPKSRIHSFEPTTATHARLAARMASRSNVVCHRLALADFAKNVMIEVSPLSVLNSLQSQIDNPRKDQNIDKITVTTLETFCTELGVNQIDVLKIDAQGYDLAVLRGGERLLREEVIPFIVVEASILPGDTTNQPLEAINSYLASFGYAPAGIYDPVYHGPSNCYLGCFNVLYIHPHALTKRFPGWSTRTH
jgi:FkbM family methyltransferase